VARGEARRTFELEIQLHLATLCEAREAETAKSSTLRSFECHRTAPIRSLAASTQNLIVPGTGGIGDDSLLPRAKFASEELDWTLGEFGQLGVNFGTTQPACGHKTWRILQAFPLELFRYNGLRLVPPLGKLLLLGHVCLACAYV
jgi:hypothetical protein